MVSKKSHEIAASYNKGKRFKTSSRRNRKMADKRKKRV